MKNRYLEKQKRGKGDYGVSVEGMQKKKKKIINDVHINFTEAI